MRLINNLTELQKNAQTIAARVNFKYRGKQVTY